MKSLVAGRLVQWSPAQNSAHVARTALGGGCFTTLGVVSGKPLFLAEHLERLKREAKLMRLPATRAESLRDLVKQVLQANRLSAGVIRLGWLADERSIETFALCEPTRLVPRRVVLKLVEVEGPPVGRYAKSAHHLRWDSYRHQALRAGVFDVLAVRRGWLTECTRFNLFLELEGRLCTPPENEVFCGIAREGLLADRRVSTSEQPLTISHLVRASRVMLLNSVRGWIEADLVVDPAGRKVWPSRR